jgi:hypothetical protein
MGAPNNSVSIDFLSSIKLNIVGDCELETNQHL